MKKVLLALFVIFMTTYGYSQVRFGIGGVAGTQSGIKAIGEEKINFGLHARLKFDIPDSFGLIGGVSYYLPSTKDILGGEIKSELMEFNVDLLYYLVDKGPMQLYGLGGAVYSTDKYTTSALTNRTSELGWEAGAGVKITKFFFEAKWDNRLQQIVGIAGFYF